MANAVRELSKVLDGPIESAYKEMLRAIKYVLDTKGRGLRIHPVMRESLKWVLVLYSDSDWSSNKDGRRSIGGYMLFVNGVLVGWRSKKQKVVSLSSSEAEFYALAEAVKEIPFIIQVLAFLGVPVETPVTVCVDNIGAIFMIENPSSSSRTRHMSTRYFYVMDLQNDKVIIVKFIGSAENLANIATKNVLVQVHEQHIDKVTVEQSYVDG
jgi:predicted RNA-binding protein with TRAM domain